MAVRVDIQLTVHLASSDGNVCLCYPTASHRIEKAHDPFSVYNNGYTCQASTTL